MATSCGVAICIIFNWFFLHVMCYIYTSTACSHCIDFTPLVLSVWPILLLHNKYDNNYYDRQLGIVLCSAVGFEAPRLAIGLFLSCAQIPWSYYSTVWISSQRATGSWEGSYFIIIVCIQTTAINCRCWWYDNVFQWLLFVCW